MTLPPVHHASHHRPRTEAKPAPRVEVADRGFRRIMTMRERSGRSPGEALPADGGGEADGRDRALIFNQFGYFGSAGPAGLEAGGPEPADDAGVEPGGIEAGGAGGDLPGSPTAGPEAPTLTSGSRAFWAPQNPPATDRRGEGSGARPGFVRPTLVAGRQARARPNDSATSIALEAMEPEPPEAGRLDSAGAARIRAVRDPAGAGSPLNLRVSLVPSGDGLDVSVRLGRLSARQRAELRLEIARLLARYGIHVGEVLLNGTVEPSRRF